MSIQINSLSSSLMLGITLYRNQSGISNKIIAQGGYALTALISVIESVVALAFTGLSLIASPFSFIFIKHSTTWLDSSSFTLGWSITDFFLNPLVSLLVADERTARQILKSRNLMLIPCGAVL